MIDYSGDFGQRDYKSMTFNVMLPEVVPTKHSFFKGRPAFSAKIKGIDNNMLIKYICLFYDPQSPLQIKISDHIARKKAAAILAGFPTEKDALPPDVVEVLYCKTAKANDCIMEYLRGLMAPDWAFICAGWESYYKILEEIQGVTEFIGVKQAAKTSTDDAKVRAVLTKQASDISDNLTERTMKFLSRDESPYLRKHLFSLIEKERKLPKITPERQIGIEA